MACRFPLVRSYPRALEVQDGCVVGDSNPTPPAILPPDFLRIGRHGLEIIIAVAKSFPIHQEAVGKRLTASVLLSDSDRWRPSAADWKSTPPPAPRRGHSSRSTRTLVTSVSTASGTTMPASTPVRR